MLVPEEDGHEKDRESLGSFSVSGVLTILSGARLEVVTGWTKTEHLVRGQSGRPSTKPVLQKVASTAAASSKTTSLPASGNVE